MAEVKVHADPTSYEARNIFGVLSKRQAIAAAVIAVVMVPAVIVNSRLGWGALSPLMLAASIPCIAAGACLTAPVHGLRAEKWLPIVLRARMSPAELYSRQRTIELTRASARPSRAERRAERRRLKAEAAQRAAEVEDRRETGVFDDLR